MPPSLKYIKPTCISVLVLIIVGIVAWYGYNKLYPPPQHSLSFKVDGTAKSSVNQAAAVLLALPSMGSFNIGDIVNVSLLVNTTNQSINAVAGTVTFPQDKLEMASTSKTNSIISLWVEEPSLNTASGTITFSGIVPSPGFTGQSGQIINVSFKVKGSGAATIDVKDAQVLANDGLGTNILTEVVPSNLTLVSPISQKVVDINGDGKVDLSDVSVLISHWGVAKGSRFDLSGDGIVDIKDLSILISKWGQIKK